jgi:cytochrome c peroxidase
MPNGNGQRLNMTQQEKDAVIAFLRTLSGTNVYVDEKWSTPFL